MIIKLEVSASKCDRCGYVWLPRRPAIRCARCKSPKWNKPVKEEYSGRLIDLVEPPAPSFTETQAKWLVEEAARISAGDPHERTEEQKTELLRWQTRMQVVGKQWPPPARVAELNTAHDAADARIAARKAAALQKEKDGVE